jgi:hypothetical protein
VTAHTIGSWSGSERGTTKPFNPILGETFEFITGDCKFFAEQVSHHPPIAALHMISPTYTYSTTSAPKIAFNGKNLSFVQVYRAYIDLKLPTGDTEHYEVIHPVMSIHNLVFGK